MDQSVLVYLALGSNQGDRVANLRAAIQELNAYPAVDVTGVSPVYESEAVTRGDEQPPYLNAVLKVFTELEPRELLTLCLEIERCHGRLRTEGIRWEARTLDIDVLLYGQESVEEPGLEVPHPRMAQRAFVLQPLHDLAPNLYIPSLGASVSTLLAECTDNPGLVRLPVDLREPPETQAELWPGPSRRIQARMEELPRDVRYVVIEGVIGAGKTSLARLLAKRFNAQEVFEEFEENPFLERFYQDRSRWAFQTQLAFLASRFKQQQQLGRPDLFHETVVSDYMFDKDRLFAQQTLAGDELRLYDTMFGIMQASVPRPDLIVYLQASTDRLMKMIAKRGRSYEQDMDRGYIHSLNQAYEQFFFQYNKTPLLIVNTEQIDFVHEPDDLEEIAEQIARFRYAGTTYFNPARS